jgi:hypothetical protein
LVSEAEQCPTMVSWYRSGHPCWLMLVANGYCSGLLLFPSGWSSVGGLGLSLEELKSCCEIGLLAFLLCLSADVLLVLVVSVHRSRPCSSPHRYSSLVSSIRPATRINDSPHAGKSSARPVQSPSRLFRRNAAFPPFFHARVWTTYCLGCTVESFLASGLDARLSCPSSSR